MQEWEPHDGANRWIRRRIWIGLSGGSPISPRGVRGGQGGIGAGQGSREFESIARRPSRALSWGCALSEFRSRLCRPCVVAALLSASFLGGCKSQLAVQDSYFTRSSETVGAQGAQVKEMVRYNQALQAVRRTCLLPGSGADRPDGPDLQAVDGRKAHADLCAASRRPAPRARGGILNGYGRWVQGDVPDLPESSATASRAGGGS